MNQTPRTFGRSRLTAIIAAVASAALMIYGLQPAMASPVTSAPMVAGDDEQTIQISNPGLVSEPQLNISGKIEKIVVDLKDSTIIKFFVHTAEGSIPIDGDLAGVSRGGEFSGTLALPDAVLSRMGSSFANRASKTGGPLSVSRTERIQLEQIASTQTAPLQIVTARITVSEISLGSAAHTIDVAVLNGTSFSDSTIDSNIADLSTFWVGQSNNQITGITRPNAVQRYNSSFLASCDFSSMWDEAAAKFLGVGHTADEYAYYSGRHLLLVVDQPYSGANCGAGIGSVGGGDNGSGVTFANVNGDTDLNIIAHEFGHNLGLGHANVHECTSEALVEGTVAQGCDDYDYQDYYDVMAGAFEYYGVGTTNHLAALNVTEKQELNAYPIGDLHTVSSQSETVTLLPASSSSGIRGIWLTDPYTGTQYFVEYRSGTGMDAGAFYTLSFPPGSSEELESLRPGVRILKLKNNDQGSYDSFALAQLKQDGESVKMLALSEGQIFETPSSALSVTFSSTSSGNAIINVAKHYTPSTTRVSGSDRYATAVALSQASFPSGAPVVYVAQGANYPDALAAAPAAVKEGGPLLLTNSTSLTPSVKAEIQRLNPSKIVVVGGTGVIKPAVFNALQALVPGNTIRLGGADRYATSRLVIQQAFGTSGATFAYVATGAGFPDALSGSAAAGSQGVPIILVNGSASAVDAATKALMQTLGITDTRIVGGVGVVNASMANSLATFTTVTRFGGANRFDTNHLVNEPIFTNTPDVYLATGYQFPDALAGAAVAGGKGAPLYLSQTSCLPHDTHRDIILGDTALVTIIGGYGVLTVPIDSLKECGATYQEATS